jgi:hypothetical protein
VTNHAQTLAQLENQLQHEKRMKEEMELKYKALQRKSRETEEKLVKQLEEAKENYVNI